MRKHFQRWWIEKWLSKLTNKRIHKNLDWDKELNEDSPEPNGGIKEFSSFMDHKWRKHSSMNPRFLDSNKQEPKI